MVHAKYFKLKLLSAPLWNGKAILSCVENIQKSLSQCFVPILILFAISELLNQDLNKTSY